MRKIFVGLLISVLLCLMVVPVFADSLTCISNWEYSYSTTHYMMLSEEHPSETSYRSAVAQTFNASVGWYLAEVHVWMKVWQGTVFEGSASCRVEGVGADGLAGSPNGTVYAEAVNSLSFEEMSGVDTEYTFTFNSTYQLVEGAKYALVVYVSNGTGLNYGAGKRGVICYQDTPASHEGQMCYFDNGYWSEAPTFDLFHEVWVSETSGGSGGSGTPTGGGNEVDDIVSGVMWWILYLIVMLTPAFLLGVVAKMGKWGFMIGLAIGAGLGYVFMPGFPLVVLFLVGMGEFLMFFAAIRGGG